MLAFVFVLVICQVFGSLRSVEELRDSAVVVDGSGRLRAYEAVGFPLLRPTSVLVEGINIQKTGEHSGVVDAVVFALDTVNQASLAFGYYHGAGQVDNHNTTDLSASAFGFLLRSFYVFEYNEGNGVDGFQNGTADNITGFYDLSTPALNWKEIVINKSSISVNGTQFNIWYITAETTDGVFLVRFTVVGIGALIGGVKLSPDSVKVDVSIKWFTDQHVKAAWTTGPSNAAEYPNAQVGLISAVLAGAKTVSSDATNSVLGNSNPTVSYESDNITGFFSYETSADVVVQGESASRSVHVNVTSDTDPAIEAAAKAGWLLRVFWFSFDGARPSEVSYDPEFGADINYEAFAGSVSASNFLVPSIILAIISLFMF